MKCVCAQSKLYSFIDTVKIVNATPPLNLKGSPTLN